MTVSPVAQWLDMCHLLGFPWYNICTGCSNCGCVISPAISVLVLLCSVVSWMMRWRSSQSGPSWLFPIPAATYYSQNHSGIIGTCLSPSDRGFPRFPDGIFVTLVTTYHAPNLALVPFSAANLPILACCSISEQSICLSSWHVSRSHDGLLNWPPLLLLLQFQFQMKLALPLMVWK